MTQQDQSISKVKSAASFSEVLEDKGWGSALRKAAEVGSVAIVEAHEQPSPTVSVSTAPKPRRPR